MSTRKRSVTETIEKDTFELELPTELAAIKPLHTIKLPGKHVGLIFEETLSERSKARNQGHYSAAAAAIDPDTKGYRYMVRKEDGSPAGDRAGVGHWAGQFYDNLLDLKLAVEYDAQVLTPKTRTRRERDEDEG